MTIKEVYEKYKHLDKLFSDKEWVDMSSPFRRALYDMWQAIKEEVEGFELMEAVDSWQDDETVHPLTCGNDSKHKNLISVWTDKEPVHLECPDCDYIQAIDEKLKDILIKHLKEKP